jgi:hypothetical protein
LQLHDAVTAKHYAAYHSTRHLAVLYKYALLAVFTTHVSCGVVLIYVSYHYNTFTKQVRLLPDYSVSTLQAGDRVLALCGGSTIFYDATIAIPYDATTG